MVAIASGARAAVTAAARWNATSVAKEAISPGIAAIGDEAAVIAIDIGIETAAGGGTATVEKGNNRAASDLLKTLSQYKFHLKRRRTRSSSYRRTRTRSRSRSRS